MTTKVTYRLLIICSLLFTLACNSQDESIDIIGRWKVSKAEVDGYSITDEYSQPSESWVYFEKDGLLLGGRELSEHSGTWKLHSNSKLHLTSSSPRWDNTIWQFYLVDSVMYLKGTKKSNNYTRKLWLVPEESEVPPYRQFSEHDKRLSGTWNLLRIKRNSKLIRLDEYGDLNEDPRITFLESGIYNSNLQGEDSSSAFGVWDLSEYDLKLSLFPFNTPNNKRWDYRFSGDLLRLSSIESMGGKSMQWEWVWKKAF